MNATTRPPRPALSSRLNRLLARSAWIAVGCLGLATQAQAPGSEAWPRWQRRATSGDAAQGHARVIVRYKAGSAGDARTHALSATASAVAMSDTGPARAAALSTRHGLALTDGRALDSRTQVLHSRGLSSAALAARLSADPEVEYAEVDRPMRAHAAPNDPLYPTGQTGAMPVVGQWYLRAPTVAMPAAINAEGAWDITTGSASVVVAVLDTGVRTEHPDLAGKLLPGYDFISDAAVANDNDGRDADPSDPGDWVSSSDIAGGQLGGCSSADIGSSSWHGTQTAGIVGAATNNGVGVAGVGRNVSVLPVRVLGKCGGFQSDVIAGMQWAAGIAVPGVPANANPAKVVNLSLGATGACGSTYQSTVNVLIGRGVTVVAAAGNEGLAVDSPGNCSGVIGVAGVRHAGTKVGYSNLGPEVALAAPAGNCVNSSGACLFPIVTTTNSGTQAPSTNTYSDAFNSSIGTSFSAPQVAGTAGLMLSVNGNLTPAQIRGVLRYTARTFPTGSVAACQAPSSTAQDSECACTTTTCGAGMLDTAAAVQLAAGSTTARIHPPTHAQQGGTLVLDGSASTASPGRTLVSYAWAVVSGTSVASVASSNAGTTTLNGLQAGTATVQLTVVDSQGQSSSTTQSVVVDATTSSDGGGGGAIDPAWLLLAGLAAGGWARQRRRSSR